ncbi:MAG: hypothetical protein J6B77_05540 [Clostridia bacterium]|nr:hypothetical protein [Clostridia bacterium]
MTNRETKGALLGIDLGTSSVKILLRHADGTIVKSKASYASESPDGWWDAVTEALRAIDLSAVCAVGLSSQTGTYIFETASGETHVLGWRDGTGKETLDRIRAAHGTDVFLREIAMPHPPLVSYPIPRLTRLGERYGKLVRVCQPKDVIVERLCGVRVSDVYTWRGLANPHTGKYSAFFLSEIGLSESALPPLKMPTDLAGTVSAAVSKETGLSEGTPVYLGMNDFFASIVGMGITDGGMFDITGTSEHLGVVSGELAADTALVSGPYLSGYVHYGVTASGGASLDFMRTVLGDLTTASMEPEEFLSENPPIYLPYLAGERAPIFDGDARGVFFGLTKRCTRRQMSYAVCEGLAFSLYHIYESMGQKQPCPRVTLSGGAARILLLSQLKAEIFGKEFVMKAESDTSALGAAMAAGIGCGAFRDYADATAVCCRDAQVFTPTGKCREKLLSRYAIYRELYPALKTQMHAFAAMEISDQ